MPTRLHILDVPWSRDDLWDWFEWQVGLDHMDPNYVVSAGAVDPRYRITEKMAFGMRLLLFWRRIYRRSWTLGSSTRSVAFVVGTQAWCCGLSTNPVFRNPSEREQFTAACAEAVNAARTHFHLNRYSPSLPDGAVRFHAFCEFAAQYDMSASQEAYTAGTSSHVSSEAVDIDRDARTFNPAALAYAPVVRINALLACSFTGMDWAVTEAEEEQILEILLRVLMYGIDHWPADSTTRLSIASITAIRDTIRDSQAEPPIPAINVREFHRVLLYCDAGRLNSSLENHWGGSQNNSNYTKLLEIMDTCIQRRSARLSASSVLLERNASHLLY